MAIADDHGIVAVRAAHASWPTMLTHKLKTLGLVQQPREIDHLRYRYACAASKTTRSRLHPIRSETWLQRYPSRATTPEPNKSHPGFQSAAGNAHHHAAAAVTNWTGLSLPAKSKAWGEASCGRLGLCCSSYPLTCGRLRLGRHSVHKDP